MNDRIMKSRRRFTTALGAGGALAALGGCAALDGTPSVASGRKLGRVVVVGGGYGGATAARYLKTWAGPAMEVVLVERERQFVSCPMSNRVIGGTREMDYITHGYDGLRKLGVIVINDEVTAIDTARKRVSMTRLADQGYDRLVVSPGIDFNYSGLQGLDEKGRETVLHAWKAGPQTQMLRRQLEAMPDGGTYVLTIPRAPYRCPPGPYERTCLVAHYFKTRKPKSKLIVLDANPDIQSKKGLFLAAWNGLYPGMIEYRPNSNVVEVDVRGSTLITEFGDRIRGDVLNVVPPQGAGEIARKAGLVNVNNRWCDVDWLTLESTAVRGVHVLGDATQSAMQMPKSGHMANQHGKSVAAAIIEMMSDRAPPPPVMANTCYSFVSGDSAMHVASVHQWVPDKKTIEPVSGAGGVSSASSELEGRYAAAWAQNIWRDMLAA